MNLLTKAGLLLHIARWRLLWSFQNTKYSVKVRGNPKFMGPREAVSACIRDGDLVGFSGLGGSHRPSIMYWAIRDMFKETGHPRDLQLLAIGGIGGRGRIPGTIEELGHPGLVKRMFAGHMETYKSILKLADQGHTELQTMPQGILAFLLAAQGRGEDSVVTRTGTGTFVDPRVGRGSPITNGTAEQFVSVEGDQLRYRIPPLNVAVFNVPAADREGNLYLKNAAMLAECRELTRAARRNGGKVIANVGLIVDKGCDEVFLPAEDVDAIVVWRRAEQAAGIEHRRHWPMFSTKSNMPLKEAIPRVRFINEVMGITPRRTPPEFALARLAAWTFTHHAHKGNLVNIGVGLPEEACRLMYEGGVLDDITLFTESGVMGGVPSPGIFFGTAICPTKMVSSADIFKMCYEKLDVTILGALQVDSSGNVNVSNRGKGAINYVGPGGFIDLTTAAKMAMFVTSWMDRAEFSLEGGKVRITKPGKIKFIDKVDEVTFNGHEALKTGKKVFYVTTVGTFRLTARGMELMNVMPGIDIRKDILEASPMKIVLPESGDVPVADASIVTGEGFRLSLQK
jgi:propionate CoA-transferase